VVLQAPTQLTQDYFECYEGDFSAFFDAVGIASGNTSLAVPVLSCILLPLLYVFLILVKLAPPQKEYNKLEKDQALDILSLLLLRLRDGKTRGVKKNGVLMYLTKELIDAAREEGGYPDSDDEEEEEDPAETFRGRLKRKSKKIERAEEGNSDDEEGDSNRPSVAHRKGGDKANRRGSANAITKYGGNRRHQMQVFTK
jgi:hypothetical protein